MDIDNITKRERQAAAAKYLLSVRARKQARSDKLWQRFADTTAMVSIGALVVVWLGYLLS